MYIGKIDHVAATPHVPAAGSTGLQVTSSKRLFDLTEGLMCRGGRVTYFPYEHQCCKISELFKNFNHKG